MTTHQDTDLLRDVRQFIRFLSGLWGMLSSLTLLFPLSNVLLEVLPADETQLSIYTALTTMSCCFTVLYMYIARHRLIRLRIMNSAKYDGRLVWTFIGGLCASLIYLLVHFWYGQTLEDASVAATVERGAAWVIGILLYGSSFVSLTASFTGFAIIEYSKHSGDMEEVITQPYETLKAENENLGQQLADLQEYMDRQRKRLSQYEQEEKVRRDKAKEDKAREERELVTAVGKIKASSVLSALKQGIKNLPYIIDVELRATPREDLAGINPPPRAKGGDTERNWRYHIEYSSSYYSGPAVNWIDLNVLLTLEPGTDISVATNDAEEKIREILGSLRLGAGHTSISVKYAE
jgi:Skp family chaperone for outer membrane proteins